MAARLRHLAIAVPDVAAAQAFFEEAFGMTKVGDAGRGVSGAASEAVARAARERSEQERETQPLTAKRSPPIRVVLRRLMK